MNDVEKKGIKAIETVKDLKAERDRKLSGMQASLDSVDRRLDQAEKVVERAKDGNFETYKTACHARNELREEKEFYEHQIKVLTGAPYITQEQAIELKSVMAAAIAADADRFHTIAVNALSEMARNLDPVRKSAKDLNDCMMDLDILSGKDVPLIGYDNEVNRSWNWLLRAVCDQTILKNVNGATMYDAERFVNNALKDK